MKYVENLLNISLFVVMGSLGVLTAYLISSKYLSPSYSQTDNSLPPPPPVEATQMPPPPSSDGELESTNGSANTQSLSNTENTESEQPSTQNEMSPMSAENLEINGGLLSFLEPFIYRAQDGRRDPFKEPVIDLLAPIDGNNIPLGPVLPLQRFDLTELTLTGILWDVINPKAMFLDPTSKVHIVSKDQRIGRNNGYVAVIREGEVVVVETTRVNGELTYTTRILRIEGAKDE